MSSFTLDHRAGKPLSRSSSCSRLRCRIREIGRSFTTPLGTTGLAVLAFWGGMIVTAETGFPPGQVAELQDALAAEGEALRQARTTLTVREMQLDRLEQIHGFSTEYGISAGLGAKIYDIALAEGIRPELAFRLVETESSFRRGAISEAGAVGYTQIKPSTAAWLDSSVSYDQLFETETNLRLGFRYFSLLLERYAGDERLALLAYNRGPTRVGSLLAMGQDPGNGYAQRILSGR